MATNLWTLPPDRGEETVQVLHQSRRVRVEKIVSYGQASPEGFWYDQPEDEWSRCWRAAPFCAPGSSWCT